MLRMFISKVRLISLILGFFCMGKAFSQEKQAPNIIFILTDDQGWTHTSHRAAPNVSSSKSDFYETPHMDRLANSGIMFTRGYAPNPICSPTRHSIMFGQNAARHIYNRDKDWYKNASSKLTIPKVLKQANGAYQTAHFGKWHIALLPEESGFDYHEGMTSNSAGNVFGEGYLDAKAYAKETVKYLRDKELQRPSGIGLAGKPSAYWSDDNPKDIFGMTGRAINFMEESIYQGKPFYVQLSHYATHLALSSKKETYDYFSKKEKGTRHSNPEFAAMLKDLDTSVGMLLDFIKEQRIEDNTYIFLMGDNGGRNSLNQVAIIDNDRQLVSAKYTTQPNRNIPLKDGKHSFYEGGLRVPFMAIGPGIKSNRVSNLPVTGLDLLPTFAELAGHDHNFSDEIDGGSLVPLLLDEKTDHVSRNSKSLVFHQAAHRKPRSAIIKGNYKLIKYWIKESKYPNTPGIELYNIEEDFAETNNIAAQNPRIVYVLENELLHFLNETKAETNSVEINGPFYRLLDDVKEEEFQPAKLVYPLLDAANSRWFFFSSATRPFGMVNLSPDMGLGGAWSSGYRYDEKKIRFFSHIHAWQLSGIPVMPTTGTFQGHLGSEAYASSYSHDNERVESGYHSIILDDYDVKAELTSTTRVGFHRYTYSPNTEKHILLDLGTQLGPSPTKMGKVSKISEREVAGYALMEKTRRRPKDTYVYFVIQFDKSFHQMRAWQDKKLMGETNEFEGENGGVYVSFGEKAQEVIQMKVAISYVNIDQARLNMNSELPHWKFDQVRQEAFDEWNEWLSRIKVEGGTLRQRSRFYTDLWHALQGRRIISDYNGKYCDMTGEKPRIGQIPLDEKGKPKFNHFNSDSFWGAQWTLNTLWHLVYPEISEQFVHSMLTMYEDGGLIPRGPSGGNYTYVMTGASSTPFIVSAYMKGIRNFDVEKAYQGLSKNALPGGIMGKAGYEHTTELGGGLKYYIRNGYVPFPMPDKNNGYHNEGAGQTLEYAYQDWCLYQMAKALNKADTTGFKKRSLNYQNVWDESVGWMRPRDVNGKFEEPFNPIRSHHGFVESTAAQSTWFVPHDMHGLFNLMGGAEAASTKLNQQFLIGDAHDFICKPFKADRFVQQARRNTYINYSNQPSMQLGHIFNYLGKPWLTQYWTREVIDRIYSDLDPYHGYNGDEDQGLMGSLAVLLKIGLFEMRGGAAIHPIYEIGSPIFDKVIIKLNKDYYSGEEFVIETKNNSSQNRYIQSANFNGEKLNQSWFYHKELIKGGRLFLEMGKEPNQKWGSDPNLLPPSMSSEK